MKSPLVSIILPVYNGENFLAEALGSVLKQSYEPVEIIVVDDGSTDKSAVIAQSFEALRYFRQSNQGVAIARNYGLALSKGEIIAFIDADDVWLPNKLDTQVSLLIDRPEIDGTLTMINNFASSGETKHQNEIPLHKEQLAIMTLVVWKTVFDQVGNFSPTFNVGSDFDWLVRARDQGFSLEILPDILTNRRVHEGNLSHQTKNRQKSMLSIFRASINRKKNR